MLFTPLVLPSALACALLFALVIASWQLRNVKSAVPFGITMISIAFWALVYSLEIVSRDLGTKILFARLRFLGIGPMIAAWLVMAIYHAGLRGQIRGGWLALLAVEPVVTAVMAFTNDARRLFRFNYRMDAAGPVPLLVYDNGLFFWIHYVYMEAVFVSIIVILVRSLQGSRPWYRRQTITIIVGTLLPLAFDLVFQLGLTPLHAYNLSMPAMAVSGAIVGYAIFRYHFLQIAPVARSIIVENMDDVMLVMDEQGRLVDFNPAAERAFGIVHARDTDRPAGEVLEPQLAEVLAELGESGMARREMRGEAVGGRIFDVSVAPITSRTGIFLGQTVTLHDVSERTRAEEELRASEDLFRGFIEQSGEAIILTDEHGRIIEFNTAAERLMGTARGQAIGMDVIDLQAMHWPPATRTPANVGRARALLREALATGEADALNRVREGTLLRSDGAMRDFSQAAFPIRSAGGWRLGMVMNDITDMTKTAEALRHSEEQLAQAQKMEAVGRLAGGIAHDFNNLLTVIGGYADIFAEELRDGTPARESAEEIRNAAAKAANLTAQLLAFSRKQVLAPRLLDLGTLVANMERMLRRLIGEDVELVSSLTPGLGSIMADPGKIEQVIMNLAVNARDAMPHGGRLTLVTAETGSIAPLVPQGAAAPEGRWISLTVMDTGIGMSPDLVKRIFEPFFTTKEQGKGTGLGLAMVYGIVRQSGGYIFCDSAPGRGSAFTLYFPRAEGKATAVPGEEEAAPARGNGTILVVEDEEAVRSFIRVGLEKNGYHVMQAGDGFEALRMVEEEAGAVDLLVTDVVLPRMNGAEMARRMRGRRPGLRILFITGYAEDMLSLQGWEGEVEFLQKPFTMKRLLAEVEQLTRRA
jgi:two-component system, cell cycle sensor histidine kinase and response regulator CckA